MTLTQHFGNVIESETLQEHRIFVSKFPTLKQEVSRHVYGKKGKIDVPICSAKDMKLGIGLHLINFVRDTEDDKFRQYVLNEKLSNRDLDKILNYVFNPEFHVPRMVSTTDFNQVNVREPTLREIVRIHDVSRISKDNAPMAVVLAASELNEKMVATLLSMFNITNKDIHKAHPKVETLLSTTHLNINNILKLFLEYKLLNINKILTESGNTMLDNAIKYHNRGIITLLRKYGAVQGKELQPSRTQNLQ